MDWHIGCSGFHYKDWKEKFYPAGLPQRKWFEFYCTKFKTLELNVTFYRFPQLGFLENWYRISPPEFRFSVKAPRAITHYKKFNDSQWLIDSFYDTVTKGLKEKLGPVLFQLPPSFSFNEERIDRILASLDPAFKNVLEFRHVSWWQSDVYKKLAQRKIAFCGMSHPELPDKIISNTNFLYHRFHGVPDLYKSSYSTEFLKQFARKIGSLKGIEECWIYFNNDFDAVGTDNAQELIRINNLLKTKS